MRVVVIGALLATSAGCDHLFGLDHVTAPDEEQVQTYPEAVLFDAPVGYWRLGDASSAIAHDETSNHDGTYVGGCMLGTPGAIVNDAAVRFGGDCHVQIANAFGFPGDAPYTIELWVAIADTASNQHLFTRQRRTPGNGPSDGWSLLVTTSGAMFERTVAQHNVGTMRTQLPIDTFVHLVGVFDTGKLLLYVDGASAGLPATDADLMETFDFVALIGVANPATGYAYTRGVIDEVAVYDYALTAERIRAHHTIGARGF